MKKVILIPFFLILFNLSFSFCNLLESFSLEEPDFNLFHSVNFQTNYYPPLNLNLNSSYNSSIPTNKWWGNLISNLNTNGNPNPIWLNPYTIEILKEQKPYGIAIEYSFNSRFFGPLNEKGISKFYGHALVNNLILSADFTSSPTFTVTNWDDFGVFIQLNQQEQKDKKINSYFALGMAFISSTYSNLKPLIASAHALVSINNIVVKEGNTVTKSDKYILKYNNGMTWVLYAFPNNIEFISNSNGLTSLKEYSGILKTALVLNQAQQDKTKDEKLIKKNIALYDKYSPCMLKGGFLNITNSYEYNFNWITNGICSQGFLHFALPHHTNILDLSLTQPIDLYLNSTTRGKMQAFSTNSFLCSSCSSPSTSSCSCSCSSSGPTDSTSNGPTDSCSLWKLKEQEEISLDFSLSSTIPTLDLLNKYNILSILEIDINSQWNLIPDGSYYFNGKLAQKYANLCLMAKEQQNNLKNGLSLLNLCISKLETILIMFLKNSFKYPLVYDSIYKGIVSSEGFVFQDMNRDFGNTVYNDHHYHYGYWVVSCSIFNYLNPTSSYKNDLNKIILTLLRDYVNPSSTDSFFPRFRHFDWFLGHSYAHGIISLGDGKDQESTSEEFNSYYGMLLYSKTINNIKMENLAKLMLKVNKRSINSYFLLLNSNKIHPKEFIGNKVTGIYFDNKVDYSSWFSKELYCIHGIQMLPVSLATDFLRNKTFIQEEWNMILKNLPIITQLKDDNSWQSLLYSNYAALDYTKAIEQLSHVPLDDGLTRSWALYHAASMDPNALLRNSISSSIIPSSKSYSTTPSSIIYSTTPSPSYSTPSSSSSIVSITIDQPSITTTFIPSTFIPLSSTSSIVCQIGKGDLNAGLQMYYDQNCILHKGGLGCVSSQPGCRFCSTKLTQSVYLPCLLTPLATTSISSYPSTKATSNTKVTSYPSSTKVTSYPSTTKVTSYPSTTKVTSYPSTTKVTSYPSTTKVTSIPPSIKVTRSPLSTSFPSTSSYPNITSKPLLFLCNVSIGDQEAGLGMYYDLICIEKGGLGCDSTRPGCRFCSKRIKPSIFLPCPSSHFTLSSIAKTESLFASSSIQEIQTNETNSTIATERRK